MTSRASPGRAACSTTSAARSRRSRASRPPLSPDARELHVAADPTSFVHAFRVPALELRAHLDAGARLGVRYSLAACGKSLAGGMTAARMGADGWVPVTTRFEIVPGTTYRLALQIEDVHGQVLERRLSVSASGPAPARQALSASPGCG